MKKLVIVLVAVSGLAVVGNASAAEMGDRGTIALSGGGAIAVQSSSDSNNSSSFAVFTPKVAWFLADGVALSIGPRFMRSRVAYGDEQSQECTWYGGEVRLGGLIDLSDRVSLWPQIGIYADVGKSDYHGWASDAGSTTRVPYRLLNDTTAYGASAEIPIVLRLTKHTFATLSFLMADVSKATNSAGPNSKSVFIGLNPQAGVGFGGWF